MFLFYVTLSGRPEETDGDLIKKKKMFYFKLGISQAMLS